MGLINTPANGTGTATWNAPTNPNDPTTASITNPFNANMTADQVAKAAASSYGLMQQGTKGVSGVSDPGYVASQMVAAGVPYATAMQAVGQWQDPSYVGANQPNTFTAQGAFNRFQTGADYLNNVYGPDARGAGTNATSSPAPSSTTGGTTGSTTNSSGTSTSNTTTGAANPATNTLTGSPGLSGSTVGTPNTTTSPFTPANPAQINLQAPQMTIAGNIGQYLDPNSEVNQMIKTRALEAANQSGTLNSSMTQSAVANGIIANAQQMAQNDQNAYATAANQNASLATNTAVNNMQGLNQLGIAQLGQDTQLKLQNLQNQNKTLLQASSAAQQIYNQAITDISSIQNNSAFDAATKNTLINQIMSATSAQLQDQTSITGLNVGQYFGNYTAA